ncbi:MAG: hypothetical protein CW716_10280 [Candidatus Bathyarchaeum sp.]|nr:MAG: hypothetical protein CW716_10280 [Candidatus Bathyarchaeum sp.]
MKACVGISQAGVCAVAMGKAVNRVGRIIVKISTIIDIFGFIFWVFVFFPPLNLRDYLFDLLCI